MSKFKTVITTVGAAKIAAVLAGTASIVLDGNARMAIGDGGGTLPTPVPSQTKLVNEVHRAALNGASIDTRDPKNIIVELVIPPETGGFWMREMALYDAAGTLLAVGNMAETYKPTLAEGAGRKQVIRMVIAVSEVSAVTISIDTSTVMATQDYVDDKIDEHAKSRNHPDATLTAKGFTQLNSATNNASETQAATPKAVKAVMDATNLKAPLASPALTGIPTAPTAAPDNNSQQLANTAFVRAAISALINSSPGVLDTLGELAAALGNDANFAATMTTALAAKAPLASPALTGVPTAPTAAKTVSSTQLATAAFVKAVVDDYATKASPALTGTPTAPTASTGTNTTQLATTAFVQAAVAALIDASPGALDTLNELAAALGDDPNFAATMTTALAAKAPLASPALTGVPTAPTAVKTANTTQLATTEFVKAVVADYATKASPTLTGTPTAPTAAAGNNTTQVATTAFVQAAVTALINASPAALDTLKELADALGNDANFATTMTNALAGKQPLDATLTALAALATGSNKLPYFTGSDTASQTDLTGVGRDIIGKGNIADVLTYLTLKTAAQRDVGVGATQIPDMSSFTSSLAANGWQKLPGGLIIQWGLSVSTPASANYATNFPIAFPNVCLQATATFADSISPARAFPTNINSVSATAIAMRNPDNAAISQFRYIAIGY